MVSTLFSFDHNIEFVDLHDIFMQQSRFQTMSDSISIQNILLLIVNATFSAYHYPECVFLQPGGCEAVLHSKRNCNMFTLYILSFISLLV